MNELQLAIAAKLYKSIYEAIAIPGDVNAGPYKIKVPKTEWDTSDPTGSYSTIDPNGKAIGILDYSKGGEGQPNSISNYINKLQNSDGSQEKSQNLFQR